MLTPPTDAGLGDHLAALRPLLHRYCARLTGSSFDGEDVVQEVIARALAAPPPAELRPWLFRVAHNAAVDHLRRRQRHHVDHDVEVEGLDAEVAPRDPAALRASLRRFLALPPRQRAAVVLKDVLDESLDDIAGALALSVPAVKALLVRGRAALASAADHPPTIDPTERARLERYAARFNARDWDGLRALLTDDCELDLVAKARRRGPAVGEYFGRYAAEAVQVEVGVVDDRLALLAYEGASATPAYVIALGWDGDRVAAIRDWRYARYVDAL
jgi:RNA polymerase sigma-70 factor (ECF subfamily)